MKVEKGSSFSELSAPPETADERLLGYEMDFVFAVEDKMEELGMTRSQLAERLGCKKSQVTRVLSGAANITLKTVASYDAALGLGLELRPREEEEMVGEGSPSPAPSSVSWAIPAGRRDNVISLYREALEG